MAIAAFQGRGWVLSGNATPSTLTLTGQVDNLLGVPFVYDTGADNGQLSIAYSGKTVEWLNGTPPFADGSSSANEKYLLRLFAWVNVDINKIFISWEPIGHSTGVVTPSTLTGYNKTVYRTVTAASSGTILGSATGIANQYVQVSAYEDGTPNTIVGIDYTVAANGDIDWTTSSAFTGFIVVSGAVTPVNV
jgi:hypothetical protein